jgi:DNA mismatch repair protein MutS2
MIIHFLIAFFFHKIAFNNKDNLKLFPESALPQLEFDKIKTMLKNYCQSEGGKQLAESIIIHTHIDYLRPELEQSHEYKQLLQLQAYFPNDEIINLKNELHLLGIAGAVLKEDQFMLIKRLVLNIESIFRWFDEERKIQYSSLYQVIVSTYYEKAIAKLINEVLDENGQILDNATPELSRIRQQLNRKRTELRRVFDRVLQRLQKQGYLADIEESFLNSRRVVAVFAEHKRMIKGLLHGESDTRKTAFVEPEETIELNNEVFSLEHEESREIYKILQQLTRQVSAHHALLQTYLTIICRYDFIRAKARLAVEMQANYPSLTKDSHVQLTEAYHPLLFLYNQKNGKPTIPLNLTLNDQQRIIVISGPNAGGKTVTLKTVGLLQLMLQAGLLVPAHPSSQFGIFKQIMIHIGDTQSIEFELSTYSAHLQHMKHFIENANGRTLFFIDELGSGSDPNLGGAFAEVILEEMAHKHAFGIVTTHYLNLKVMANKVPGIINGAMSFDETALMPLYQLIVGKPGSSYTFSIAQRIGMPPPLIHRARKLVDEGHFRLDKLLNKAEQDLRNLEAREKELQSKSKENEKLQQEYTNLIDKERKQQQITLLKLQNQIRREELTYLKDTERKMKQLVQEWKKTDDKQKVMKQVENLLFHKKTKQAEQRIRQKVQDKYEEITGELKVGERVKIKTSNAVGIIKEIREKRAIVQVGVLPVNTELKNLVLIKDRKPVQQTNNQGE